MTALLARSRAYPLPYTANPQAGDGPGNQAGCQAVVPKRPAAMLEGSAPQVGLGSRLPRAVFRPPSHCTVSGSTLHAGLHMTAEPFISCPVSFTLRSIGT